MTIDKQKSSQIKQILDHARRRSINFYWQFLALSRRSINFYWQFLACGPDIAREGISVNSESFPIPYYLLLPIYLLTSYYLLLTIGDGEWRTQASSSNGASSTGWIDGWMDGWLTCGWTSELNQNKRHFYSYGLDSFFYLLSLLSWKLPKLWGFWKNRNGRKVFKP